jgi:outer membrane lipoprotein-sorting protein
MPRTLRRLLAIAFVLASTSLWTQGAEAHAPELTLEQALSLFAKTQESIKTLQASFEERKELSLLKEPVVQKGTFYHSKPQLFLWDYATPTVKKILLTDDLLLAYYPDMKRAEEVNVRRWTSQIRRYLQVGENLEELRKDYEVALGKPGSDDLPGATLLILTPKSKKIRAKLEQIRIGLDSESGLTRRVIYQEGDGDKTVFTFKDIVVNREIDASRYQISLPPDVKMGDSFTAFASR